MRIYKERFSEFSDFVVTIVGAFELEKIRPLVEGWLGGLPTAGERTRTSWISWSALRQPKTGAGNSCPW